MSVRFSGTIKLHAGGGWTGWVNEHPEITADDVTRMEVEDTLRMKLADSLGVELGELNEMVFTVKWG